jgi:hypothetical protein
MVLFFSSYMALEPLALEEFFADEEDFAELDEPFLLDEDFTFWLLLDFFTVLLDTGSSGLAGARSSSQAVKKDIAATSMSGTNFANIFISNSSPYT